MTNPHTVISTDIVPVILCGGSGTRLWPLSRKSFSRARSCWSPWRATPLPPWPSQNWLKNHKTCCCSALQTITSQTQFDFQELQGGVMVTFTSQASQPELKTPQFTPQVTPQVTQLMAVMQGDLTRQELMLALGLKDRKHFAEAYLKPALAAGQIKMTQPGKPNSRLQKYRLTQVGEAE